MALGKRKHEQQEAWVATTELPRSPGHPFYRRLNQLLAELDLTSVAVTFDALLTVRANLDWLVTTKQAHYIAVIKKNQPLLYAKVKALPWKTIPTGANSSSHKSTGQMNVMGQRRCCRRRAANPAMARTRSSSVESDRRSVPAC